MPTSLRDPTPGARAALPALFCALLLALAACGRSQPESPWSEARLARLTLRQKAAQMVVARVPSVAPPDTAMVRLRRWVRFGGGGFELPSGAAAPAAALAADLRRAAPLAPIVVARVERGVGGSFAGATELPALSALAGVGDDGLAGRAAAVAAAEAKALGADLLLLPGPPLPAPAGPLATPFRTQAASAALAAFVTELGEGGVLASLTSFAPPGGVRDTVPPVVGWDRAALEVTQMEPLRAAVGAGVAAVEPAYAALPALTGDEAPLPFSGVAVQGLLRRDLGVPLVVADVGPAAPAARRYGAIPAALGAVAAGADLVVGAADPDALVDSLVAAVQTGRIPAERIDRAARRVFAAKERAGLGAPPAEPADTTRPPFASPDGAEVAAEAFERTLLVFGRRASSPLAACRKTALVAHPAAPVDALVAELARGVPNLHLLRARAAPARGPLSRVPASAANDADCAVVAVFPNAPVPVVDRVAPTPPADTAGAPRDSAARARRDSVRNAPRRIVHVAFAPPFADPPSRAETGVVVAGIGAAAQRAAARALAGRREGDGAAPAVRPLPQWPAARVLVRDSARAAGMSADSLARIDRLMRQALADGVFTGGAVAVARRGRLVKLTGYGRTSGVAVDPETTLFDIASLTKVVGTTAAVMALVEDGRVRLDAPVRRYVPQFRGEDKAGITIRHLLTHTSGLPAGADLFGGTSNPDEALRRVYRTALVRDPGEAVEYSDFGMILLAEVVRRRAGEPVDRFLARRVLVPLGMEGTMYEPPLVWIDRAVPTALRSERPYVLDGVVHDGNAFRLGGMAGHAGLFSTASDLAVHAQTLLNGGAYGPRRVWSPSTVAAFTARQANAGTRTLGWDTPARRSSAGGWLSSRSYGHTGYTGTSVWIDPMREIFVVVLTNRTYDSGTAEQIFALRSAVANAAVRGITDMTVSPRIGTPEAEVAAARERARNRPRPTPRRPTRPRGRRG